MARKTYTITVILKAFFSDCRAQAKIFMSEDIKTVLDLENKISRIFGIKNFHLLSNENLLPSCEDIRLLDKGDVVCVLPNDPDTNFLLPPKFYSTNDEPIRCKKKKRKHLDDECPLKKKKSKKKKKETTLSDNEKFDDLSDQANKKLLDSSNRIKRKSKKCKDKVDINKISLPSEDSNLQFKSDKIISVLDKQLQESVDIEKENMSDEQSIKVNSEKEYNINLSSDESSGAISEIKITPVANNQNLQNSLAKFKKQTSKKLISSSNDSAVNMIVDSTSSSSDSETDKTFSTVKQSISNINQSKLLGQLINNAEMRESVVKKSTETNGFDKVRKNGCSFYHLPTKKENSWSTAPLKKTTNHVKIEKVPLIVRDIDLSKFIFNPCDIGVVPVPSHETTAKQINDFPRSGSNMINSSQHNSITLLSTRNASIEELSASACDEKNTKFNPHPNNITDKEILENIHQYSSDDECISSKSNLKSTLESEELIPLVSNKVEVDSNGSEKIVNKPDATQNIPNHDEIYSIVKTVLKTNENEQIKNRSNQSTQISLKDEKLNSNSYKRKNTTNKLGINYYLNLLNKIDWDLSKSISNVNPDENEKVVGQAHSPLHDENEMNSLQNIDISNNSNENADEIQFQSRIQELVSKEKSPSYVENKTKYFENIDDSKYISNRNPDIQSQSENEESVKQEKSPLCVENKINYFENKDISKYIPKINPDEIQSQLGNEELIRKKESPSYVENKMNSLENKDMASMSSTLNDFVTKRKRKRKHKKKIRADTPVTKSCNFLPPKKHTLVKGAPKLHIRFEPDKNDYLLEEEDEVSANFETPKKNVKVLQDVSLDLSRNEGNISPLQNTSREIDIKILSIVNNAISTKSDGVSSMNALESPEENENIVSNECLEWTTRDCIGNERNLESVFQKSALDYSNKYLTSYSNTCIVKPSSSSPKLGNASPEEALVQAKIALLKVVASLGPVQSSITRVCEDINTNVQNNDDYVEDAIDLSRSDD